MDLSLTSTGLAEVSGGRFTRWDNIKTRGTKKDTYDDHMRRIKKIALGVEVFVLNGWPVDLVVMESPSFGSNFGNPHERSGLWWEVYDFLWDRGINIATVSPPGRAKYITGSGKSKKDVVLAHAVERYVGPGTPAIPNDDVADAVGLADMGARLLGEPVVPDHLMPEDNLAAMGGVKWTPKLT